MRKPLFLLGGVLVVSAVLAASPAWATSARKTAVLNNFMVEDDTDIFLWPGVMPLYANGIFLDVETTALDGNGGFLARKGVVFGAFFHRPEPFLSGAGIPSDFQEIDTLYAGIDLDDPFKLFDILLAIPINEWHAIGFGVSFAHSLDINEEDGDVQFGERELATALTVGYTSGLKGRVQNDLGLELRFNYFKQIDIDPVSGNPEQIYEARIIPSLSLVDRLTIRKEGFFAWGIDFMFSRRDYSAEVGTADGAASRYIVGLQTGPRLTFIDRILVAASLRFMYDTYGGEMDLLGAPSEPMGWQHNFTVPGFNLATELTIFKWLFFRAAFDYRYVLGLYNLENHPVDPDEKNTTASQRFLWSVGMGIRVKGLGIDAVFSAPLFTDGPDFVGGRSPGMFSMLTLSYIF